MRNNKGKVVLAQPAVARATLAPSPRRLPLPRAPPAQMRGAGEEAAYMAGLRYRGLLHDYRELLKETEVKNRRLHMMKARKQRLLAEVRFLRKRYKSMAENPSQTIVSRLKNPSVPPPPTLRTAPAWADDNIEHRPVPAAIVGSSSSRSLLAQRRQLGPPIAAPAIDLNEACEPSHEEMELGEYHGYRQPPAGTNNTKRYHYPVEGDVAAGPSGVRMPVFWDVQSPAVRAGKRKISYQDPLLLGV